MDSATRGVWEVVDTAYPERPGPRYPSLLDAARVLQEARPAGRFTLRWLPSE